MWLYILSLWMKPWFVTIQMKAIEQYFHVVLFAFDNIAKLNSIFFSSVLNLALLEVKELTLSILSSPILLKPLTFPNTFETFFPSGLQQFWI